MHRKQVASSLAITVCLSLGMVSSAFAATTSQTTNWEWSHNSKTGTWSILEDFGAYQTSGYYGNEVEWNNSVQGTFTWAYMDNLIAAGSQLYTYAWLNSASAVRWQMPFK